MFQPRKIGFGLVALLGLVIAPPVKADEATQAFLANIDRATATLNQMQALFDAINKRQQDLRAGTAAPGATTPGEAPQASDNTSSRTYTVVLRGVMCQNCANTITNSIQSVNGAKVVMLPKPGNNRFGSSLAIVELNGNANPAAITTAVENAQTPHRGQVAPDVYVFIPGRLKASATSGAVNRALRAANLVDTGAGKIKSGTTPDDIRNALQKADLIEP